MITHAELDEQSTAESQEAEVHEPPRGALLITVTYLLILTLLWLDVYLNLLGRGIPLQ